MSRTTIRIRGLSVQFEGADGEFQAVSNVDLAVHPSEFICILGPSGAGKSTLLRVMAGVLTPTDGTITVQQGDGPERRWNPNDPSPTRALVFQNSNLLPWMSALENVTLPLRIHDVPKEEAEAQALDWFGRVGLRGVENEWPETLSGGMAQRVAIARALIQEPELLLLDEPFGALDSLTRDTLTLELMRIWEEARPSVVMVTHSVFEAALSADRILIFSPPPGRITADVRIDLPRPRSSELRYDREFLDLTRRLRALIGAAG